MAPPPCETRAGGGRTAPLATPRRRPAPSSPARRPALPAVLRLEAEVEAFVLKSEEPQHVFAGEDMSSYEVGAGCEVLRGCCPPAALLAALVRRCQPQLQVVRAAAGVRLGLYVAVLHGTGTATALIFSCTGPSRPPHRCSSSSHACVPPLHPPAAAPAGTPHGAALGAGDLDSQPRARARPHPGHPHAQHAAAAGACPPAQQAAAGLLPPLCRDAADAAGGKQPACAGKPGQLKLGQLMGCRGPAVARDTAGPPAICMFDNSRPAHHSHRPSRRSSLLTCRFRRRRGRRAGQRPPARQGWARRPLLACWSVSGLTACPRTAAA